MKATGGSAVAALLAAVTLLTQSASGQKNAVPFPRDQIALQLGALQMGYVMLGTNVTPFTPVDPQQAANALAQGRFALATSNGDAATNVVGAVNRPADPALFRLQLDRAVQAVMTSPAEGRIKGRVELDTGRTRGVTAKLSPPPADWSVPLPYAISALGGGQVGPPGPAGPQGPPGPTGGVNPTINTEGNAYIGGGVNNTASGAVSTVGGGDRNTASDEYATVGGGSGNSATNARATVAGGSANVAGGFASFVGGGFLNQANGGSSTIGGGAENLALGQQATVGGGFANSATNARATVAGGRANVAGGADSFVGGGESNTASGLGATVGGGHTNNASGTNATVGGGIRNTASADYATIGGGAQNTNSGFFATIAGGGRNIASTNYATVGGGEGNTAPNSYATVGGGRGNKATNLAATVGGGEGNTAGGNSATVGGGFTNTASSLFATVGGGFTNTASGERSTVGGGDLNTASGERSTVGGGDRNVASGTNATVPGGTRAKATNSGAFVWSGVNSVDTVSTNADSFTVRAPGGVRFITTTETNNLVIGNTNNNGVAVAPFGTAWTTLSDSNAKTGIRPIDPRTVLAKVDALPVSEWEYKHDPARRYFGPMSQDFHAAFGLGRDDKTINTLDADGVLFLSVKGLVEELKERDAKHARDLAERDKTIGELKTKLQAVEERLNSLPPAP